MFRFPKTVAAGMAAVFLLTAIPALGAKPTATNAQIKRMARVIKKPIRKIIATKKSSSSSSSIQSISSSSSVKASYTPRKDIYRANTSSSSEPAKACGSDAWTCGEWSVCSIKNVQMRSCFLSRYSCKFAKDAPVMQQNCDFFALLPKRMKDNLDKWDALHAEMTDAAKALVPQGVAGKTGIDKIHDVETRLITQYDSYNAIYQEVLLLTPDTKLYWDRQTDMMNIENAMSVTEKAFRALPKVWY